MRRFFKTKAVKLLGIIIAALLLGAVIASVAHSGNSPLSTAVVTVTRPLQQISTNLSNYLDGFCDYFRSAEALKGENAELKQKIADYQGELADYENIKRTLSVYEEFLGVKEEHPDYQFCSAEVLSQNTDSVYSSIILNKGESSGIKVNDPVIYGKNLVGTVESVTPFSCTVITISNPKFSAAVYETRSNEIGFVTGFDDGVKTNICKMPGLKKDSAVAEGGVICTLGIGGKLPKDLIVGTVSEIGKSKQDISYFAQIESNIDIDEIKGAFIITDFEGQGINEAGQ